MHTLNIKYQFNNFTNEYLSTPHHDELYGDFMKFIDTLDDNIKGCLQNSSVIGVEFYISILEGLKRELATDGIVQDEINTLIDFDFVHENNIQ